MAAKLETRKPFGIPRRLDEIMNNERRKNRIDSRGPPVWKLFVPSHAPSWSITTSENIHGHFISQKFSSPEVVSYSD
jgi:hypothetical protein